MVENYNIYLRTVRATSRQIRCDKESKQGKKNDRAMMLMMMIKMLQRETGRAGRVEVDTR